MAELQMVVFGVANERYGVDIREVQSIERLMPITRVPQTLDFIKGVVNLRGVVTPVIDLRDRFGLPHPERLEDERMIVVDVDGVQVGMLVDLVLDVQSVDDSQIDAPPAMIGGVEARYLKGVYHDQTGLLILLNLEKVLSDAEERQLKQVEKSVRG